MIVLTPEEMRKMDRQSIKDAYPELLLMEMAGRGIAKIINDKYSKDVSNISIFCGKGNNGGDGFTAARFLDMWGYNVEIIFTANEDDLSEVSYTNYKIVKLRNIAIKNIDNLNNSEVEEIIEKSDLVIDALLGTGIKGKVRGVYSRIIDLINQRKDKEIIVLSVDVPSGVDALSGEIHGQAVKANLTATMAYYKTGLMLYPGREYCGEIKVVDLGMVDSSLKKVGYNHYLLDEENAADLLPERKLQGHKGTFGKVLVIGGSKGMSGAPALVAESVLKTGAGLVKIAVPDFFAKQGINYKKEIITEFLPSQAETLSLKAYDNIKSIMDKSDILAVGPGLSQSKDIENLIEKILLNIEKPIVLDADGINGINNLELLFARKYPLILTPHPGEMSRLIDKSIPEIKSNKLDIARNFASKYGVILILKGATTVIALPDGDIYLNPNGNNGMATAGSGDVLTGIIAGLMAQGLTPEEAAILGPYLHGKSGDKAKSDLTSYSLLASDIIDYLTIALKNLNQNNKSKL